MDRKEGVRKFGNIILAATIGVSSVIASPVDSVYAASETASFVSPLNLSVKSENKQSFLSSLRSENKKGLRVIFVHGWQGGGSAPEDRDGTWVDSVKDFTRDNGIESVYPDLPGAVTPSAAVWKRIIRREVENAAAEDKNVILLSYSLGTRASLLFMDSCLKAEDGCDPELVKRVSGLVFIAPLSNDPANATRRGGAYADFFEYKVDTEKIAKTVPIKWVLHSRDDGQVPLSQGESVSKELSANLLIIEEPRGHLYEREDGRYVIGVLERAVRSYTE